MLLSIDRVLQLLAEGKDISKIAEMSNCKLEDVSNIIESARKILSKYEKPISKKKIIIKNINIDETNDIYDKSIFSGAELSAMPVNSSLTIYTDGASKGNPGPAGIGIIILDSNDNQVGKVCTYIGKGTNNYAEFIAIIRALKIAAYFNTKKLKIRTDSELIVKQITGEDQVKNKNLDKLYDEVISLKKQFNICKIEHVTRNLNEKADFLAKKGSSLLKRHK